MRRAAAGCSSADAISADHDLSSRVLSRSLPASRAMALGHSLNDAIELLDERRAHHGRGDRCHTRCQRLEHRFAHVITEFPEAGHRTLRVSRAGLTTSPGARAHGHV
jgi:hypothetical protein